MAQDDQAEPRRIERRRGLPNGRAVLGGVLVAIALLGTYATLSSADDGPTTRFVVAARALAPGTVLAASDLSVVLGDLPSSLDGRTFRGVSEAAGAVTVAPLAEGEILQAGSLAAADASVPTFTVALAASDADGGDLQPGDRVQVFATYGSDVAATTRLLSARALVVAARDGAEELGLSEGVEVRLAVSDAEERSAIINATVSGRLTLVRTTGVTDAEAEADFRPDGIDVAEGEGP